MLSFREAKKRVFIFKNKILYVFKYFVDTLIFEKKNSQSSIRDCPYVFFREDRHF